MRCTPLVLALGLLPSACGGGPTDTRSSSQGESAQGGAVNGQVLFRGERVRARVMIDGRALTTNVNGQFTFASVGPIYDATILLSDRAVVYEGLTSRSPVLSVSPQSGVGAAQVPVQLPSAPDSVHRVAVFATGADPGVAPFVFGLGEDARSTLTAGPLGASITLHALAFDVDPLTQAPARWTGQAQLTVTDLSWTVPTWNVVFAPVTSASLSVVPSAPPGYTLGDATLYLRGSDVPLASVPAGGEVAFVTANAAGVTFDVLVHATSATGGGGATAMGLAPDATRVPLSFPGAPGSRSPEDGATVTPGTSFELAPLPGVAHWVTFEPDSPLDYEVQVVTMASSVTLPDLTALGHPLRAGASFVWWVERNGVPSTVDAAASAGLVVNGEVGPLNDVPSYGGSPKRRCTLAL